LDGVDLDIDAGERVCLVGRNGTGKSTLLKVLAGQLALDDGTLEKRQDLRCAILEQQPDAHDNQTVYQLVAGALKDMGELLNEFHALSRQVAAQATPSGLDRLARVQQRLEAGDGWSISRRVDEVISRLHLEPDAPFSHLSGGRKRTALLAQALVTRPELLLLDEPTNHLDIESIEWLEDFLLNGAATLVFVTHDRRFLQRLATRIVDLDRGRLTDWPGDYETYVERKAAWLDDEAKRLAALDKKLGQEEAWIRQGIKARRTRNEGRVRALKRLREERREQRARIGRASLRTTAAETGGKLVIEADDISYAIGGKPLVSGFSTRLMRGDKVGLIGPNGVGKSTLLRLLLGELQPDSGRIRQGTRLEIAYFDQMRAGLDPDKSVLDNFSEGRNYITLDGVSQHVVSYLRNYLFSPERLRSPVRSLSGGECNRLMLARLFSEPANLLVLDEPTNDLDIETLELLEAQLVAFQGTLLLVSHDRSFLDNVVTGTWVFEGDGKISEYVGGYEDWLRQKPAAAPATRPAAAKQKAAPVRTRTKLSFKEQRELEALPAQIEAMETERDETHRQLADPEIYRDGDGDRINRLKTRLTDLENALEAAYERWDRLESGPGQASG
jgi:ATP-binding cassette subfamily F protein uup